MWEIAFAVSFLLSPRIPKACVLGRLHSNTTRQILFLFCSAGNSGRRRVSESLPLGRDPFLWRNATVMDGWL